MAEHDHDHLSVLAQLAREYQQKYMELVEAIQSTQPETMVQRLRLRAELTTDNFRAAQQMLLSRLVPDTAGGEDETYRAAIALCRSFDEMRILFQVLVECSLKPGS